MDRNLEILSVLLDPCLTMGEAVREAAARWHSRESEPRHATPRYQLEEGSRKQANGETGEEVHLGM
jgi:hypothetical protein